jgi:trehalose synthase-fused probable maltokinase
MVASHRPATIHVPGRLRDALSHSALRPLDGAPLIEFLRRQRWFGSKALADATARFRTVIRLFSEPIEAAITRVEITAGRASIATYQLPLVVRHGEGSDPGVLAVVESGEGRGILVDAVRDADFRARLLRALRDREHFEGEGVRWVAAPYGESLPEPETPSRLLEGEQSNSSVLYDQAAMLKIYRRLTVGPNPEAEIAEFLAARAFAHIPALLGLFRLVDADGSETFAGIAQQFVAAIGDGWSYARGRIRDLVISPHEKTSGRATFLDDCHRLGEITGALHRALSSDTSNTDFAPQPVGPDDLARWKEDLRRQVDSSVGLLDESLHSGTLARDRLNEAGVVLTGARALLDRATTFLSALGPGAGARIRHHGDYHLGQVLRKPDGDYVILDFEGEPARPLAERRQRHSPLRDVAGMLRSFAYAATVTVKEDVPTIADVRPFRARADALATEMQRAFRRGYFHAAPSAPVLPASSEVTEGLLTIFEIEKAFYELAYELNNRPSWADIPLAGIRELLARPLPDPRRLPQ